MGLTKITCLANYDLMVVARAPVQCGVICLWFHLLVIVCSFYCIYFSCRDMQGCTQLGNSRGMGHVDFRGRGQLPPALCPPEINTAYRKCTMLGCFSDFRNCDVIRQSTLESFMCSAKLRRFLMWVVELFILFCFKPTVYKWQGASFLPACLSLRDSSTRKC